MSSLSFALSSKPLTLEPLTSCYVWTSLHFADTSDCLISSLLTPFIEAHVLLRFSPYSNYIISSSTIGLPRFFIAIPHPPIYYVYDLEALRYEDLFHCTFPSVIQGPSSLYDYIGIWYDTICPHTPTSSTIHIGLAYVVSQRPARPLYPRLTHKPRASYGHAQGLSDWRLVI